MAQPFSSSCAPSRRSASRNLATAASSFESQISARMVKRVEWPNDPAQRPGPRDARFATRARWPGSLQRMVRRISHGANEIKNTNTAPARTIFANKVRVRRTATTAQMTAIKPSAFAETSSRYIVPKIWWLSPADIRKCQGRYVHLNSPTKHQTSSEQMATKILAKQRSYFWRNARIRLTINIGHPQLFTGETDVSQPETPRPNPKAQPGSLQRLVRHPK